LNSQGVPRYYTYLGLEAKERMQEKRNHFIPLYYRLQFSQRNFRPVTQTGALEEEKLQESTCG
jgi:hypothetical protein